MEEIVSSGINYILILRVQGTRAMQSVCSLLYKCKACKWSIEIIKE